MVVLEYKLSERELIELKSRHQGSKKRKEADRLKAVYLLGSGWKISAVREALLLSEDTIRGYYNNYKQEGLDGLLKSKYSGRQSEMTSSEKEALFLHLESVTYQRVSDIILYVAKEFDIVYSDSGMRLILKELGFVYKKPEKIPYKVNKQSQEAFIKAYKSLKNTVDKEDGLYFMDTTHPEHNAVPAHGWMKKGERIVMKSNPQPRRLNINGAINIDSLDMVVRFEERLNKETTKDFLESLRKHQPKGYIYLICDNAGYYQSPEVQSLAEAMAIKLIFLPAYSPNLNLIERVWKFFKKKVLYNKYYEEFEEMEKACKKFFRHISYYKEELSSLMTENFQVIEI